MDKSQEAFGADPDWVSVDTNDRPVYKFGDAKRKQVLSKAKVKSATRRSRGTFTEKMNAEHEDEDFVGLRVSGHTRQNNDPPPEFTGTKPRVQDLS